MLPINDPCRYYSTSIFCQIGVKEYVSTALVGTINFLTTFLAIILVDKASATPPSMLACSPVTPLSPCADWPEGSLAAGLPGHVPVHPVSRHRHPGVEGGGGGRHRRHQHCRIRGGHLCVLLCLQLCLWLGVRSVVGCRCAANTSVCRPVAWVVTSEIFPLNVRAVSVSITTAANWTGNFVVAMLTPILIASPLHIYGTFYLLSGCLLAAFFFVLFSLPETKASALPMLTHLTVSPYRT